MALRQGFKIGNYRVVSELGASGAGLLIEAQHVVLPRRAILKIVHPAFATLRPYVLQTLREACILEAIAHPGVPVVYESGVLKDRRPWFAFEVIHGPTLEDSLASGPLSIVDVACLLRDLADILAHAHRRGVIHRALRPDRIVLTAERRHPLCIPDWSEAIAHDATSHLPLAQADGAHGYVAPELSREDRDEAERALSAELIDDRVDMFALGAIAYRAMTGQLPFGDGDVANLPYVPARELRPDAPVELAAIIDALLAFDRFDRPSASEVRSDLEWLFETLPVLRPLPRIPERGVQRHASGQLGSSRAMVRNRVHSGEDTERPEPPRLRRPKWTPDVRYVDTRVDGIERASAASEDDRSRD